jgi:hypothetical protein
MSAAAGKKCCGYVGFCERANIGGIYLFEMIGAGSVQLDGKFCGAGVRELLGVDARNESGDPSGGQNFTSLRDGEGAAIAENVTEFGEVFL